MGVGGIATGEETTVAVQGGNDHGFLHNFIGRVALMLTNLGHSSSCKQVPLYDALASKNTVLFGKIASIKEVPSNGGFWPKKKYQMEFELTEVLKGESEAKGVVEIGF
ncbi:MAG: hypothetical protein H6624_05500 [Bdellovibrionaceae bacterium]|nr:hypothetical protein [Bdellovibrionales bacterium]MCB9083775.1 hypothetical protein [Pseudobdellovibrionaceae bacterium]